MEIFGLKGVGGCLRPYLMNRFMPYRPFIVLVYRNYARYKIPQPVTQEYCCERAWMALYVIGYE
jgi:hypothetical protein